MLDIIAINGASQQLNINADSKYQIVSVTGLNPPVATINVSPMATSDGGSFNSSRLPERNIVITIQPLKRIEKARDDLYKWFAPKQKVTLRVKTGSRNLTIDGYVESFEADLYANPQLVQISLICPDPYLKALNSSEVTIPGTVSNTGDVESGGVFTITMTSSGSSITITDTVNGSAKRFRMDDLTLQSGDKVIIDTRVGQKSVKLNRSGSISSLMGNVDPSSDWLQIQPGANVFTISASGTAKVEYIPQYLGV